MSKRTTARKSQTAVLDGVGLRVSKVRCSPVLGAGGHVEAASAPVDPARLARVDGGLASRDNSLAQAGGQVSCLAVLTLLPLWPKHWKVGSTWHGRGAAGAFEMNGEGELTTGAI